MIQFLRTRLETPYRWFPLATAGTLLLFSTFLFLEASPTLAFLSMITMLFSPFFLVLTTWRYGLKMGAAVAATASVILVTLFQHPLLTFLFLAQFVAVGLLLGAGLRAKAAPLRLLFLPSLASTFLVILAAAAYMYVTQRSPAETLQLGSEALRLAFEESVRRFNLDPDELMQYRKNIDTLLGVLKTALPALLFMNSFSIVYLNLLVPKQMAPGLGLDAGHVPPLRDVAIPFSWVWGLIASGLLYLLKVPYLKWAGLNLSLILLTAYLMQGFGILAFYLARTRLPAIARGLVYGVCLLNAPLLIALCGIGLFDTWFNFRKRPNRERTANRKG